MESVFSDNCYKRTGELQMPAQFVCTAIQGLYVGISLTYGEGGILHKINQSDCHFV